MDDGVGLRRQDRPADGTFVQQVEPDGLRAERRDPLAVTWRPEAARYVMALPDELSDERHPDRTARSCHEHTHDALLLLSRIGATASGVACLTPGCRRMCHRPIRQMAARHRKVPGC
jgi:hypothetical protein